MYMHNLYILVYIEGERDRERQRETEREMSTHRNKYEFIQFINVQGAMVPTLDPAERRLKPYFAGIIAQGSPLLLEVQCKQIIAVMCKAASRR